MQNCPVKNEIYISVPIINRLTRGETINSFATLPFRILLIQTK